MVLQHRPSDPVALGLQRHVDPDRGEVRVGEGGLEDGTVLVGKAIEEALRRAPPPLLEVERTEALVSTHDKQGNIVEFYRDAPVYLKANFVISVWGNSPGEENLLLGLIIKTFLENTMLSGAELKGEAFYPDDKVNIYPNLQADHNDLMSFWRAMNEDMRPALFYYVRFRVESDRKSSEVRRVMSKEIAVNR